MSDLPSPFEARPARGAAIRQRLMFVGLLGVLIGGLAIAFAISSNNGEPDENGDPREDADATFEVVAVDLAGAYDGLDSLGLPVAAVPDTGLVDGQIVVINGSGFDPNTQVGWSQCRFRVPIGGQDDCDLGNIGLASTDANGEFQADFTVNRYVNAASGTFDCVTSTLDDGCGIGAGTLSDYDKSGSGRIFFDPLTDGVSPPRIEVDQSSGLVDGQQLLVTGSGFAPGSSAYLTQCPIGGSNGIGSCYGSGSVGDIQTDANGNFAVTVPAQRVVSGSSGDVDCYTSPYPCQLIVQGSATANTISLGYDGGLALAREMEITVNPNTDLTDGDTVTVTVFDVAANGILTMQECVDQGPLGEACGPEKGLDVQAGDGASTILISRFLTNVDGNQVDCGELARTCYLKLWSDSVEAVRVPLNLANG
jgi:hypothetical protein